MILQKTIGIHNILIFCVQAEVLVCARGGGGMLRESMQLLAQLWAAGIRAETMHAAAPSTTAQYEYAHARGMGYMVTIEHAAFSAKDTVLVISVMQELCLPRL